MKPAPASLTQEESAAIVLQKKKSTAILLQLAKETSCGSSLTSDAAKCVYISKHTVLEQAMQLLSMKIHEAKACTVGNDQIIGSICIDVPAKYQHTIVQKKLIFGDYKLTEEDALESAKLADLIYLQKKGIISVDDVNLAEVAKCEDELADCRKKLLAASSFSDLFQEGKESLKTELAIARAENSKLLDTIKLFHVKQEVAASEQMDNKTDVLAIQTSCTIEDISTPQTNNSKPGTRLLHRGKQRNIHETGAKRALFKK